MRNTTKARHRKLRADVDLLHDKKVDGVRVHTLDYCIAEAAKKHDYTFKSAKRIIYKVIED